MDRHRHKPPWFIFMKYEKGKQAPYEMHGVSVGIKSVWLCDDFVCSCVELPILLMKFDLFYVITFERVSNYVVIKAKDVDRNDINLIKCKGKDLTVCFQRWLSCKYN